MKRFVRICIICIIIFTIIFSCIIHLKTTNDVVIGIDEIIISEITDDIHLDYWFEEYHWSNHLKNQVNNNKSEYFWVTIGYTIKNNSKNHTMNRVRFFPQYNGKIKEMLVEYTTENEIFTYVHPEQQASFAQRLLIRKMGHSPEAVESLIKKQKVKVKYSGGKKYIFSIQEAIEPNT